MTLSVMGYLVGMAVVLAAAAAAGRALVLMHRAHLRAERQAEEDALAEHRELYAAWSMIRSRPPQGGGGQGPAVLDPRDQLPI
jgi:hypothetical protein